MSRPARMIDHLRMEIRLVLDGIEPPTGRLYVLSGTGARPSPEAQPVAFTGWLGLLRALSEVVAGREKSPPGED